MFDYVLTSSANKELLKLPINTQKKIIIKLISLKSEKHPILDQGVKKLVKWNPVAYRLKVSDYRVIFYIENNILVCTKIFHRQLGY